ncbi:MAG: peptidylprolyl isomerase [Candidatus Obscuribacterales bacterium]|nr:peptidylprolyl isomerase [Candidatus Obscuribacterales bacterium]
MTNTAETPEESLVAKVGDRSIDASEILVCLLRSRNWKSIEDSFDMCFLEDLFENQKITFEQDEVYQKAMQFRQQHALLTAQDMHKWMELNHQSEDDFLEMCAFDIKLKKLKELLFSKRLEEVFVYKRLELVTAELYKIVLAQEEVAREILSSVKDGGSFFNFARQHSIDVQTAKACGYMGKLRVSKLNPRLQEAVSKGKSGDLIGPVKVGKVFEIYLLDNVCQPVLDDEMKQELEDELYTQWLAETKARLHIQWFI